MRNAADPSFASDNTAAIHPRILEAIRRANHHGQKPYGHDTITLEAEKLFRKSFGKQARVAFAFNGTGANVLGLATLLKSHEAILCAERAHIVEDECGAVEKILGSKTAPVPHRNGKLTPELLESKLGRQGDEHHVQYRVVSITQSTELGTVYEPKEVRELSRFCKKHDLFLHLDGARLSNACATLGCDFGDVTTGAGVDVASLGGTKNGLMLGESTVVLNPRLPADLLFRRKQMMQLYSKMRFVSAQFIEFFKDDFWREQAEHANGMAKVLRRKLEDVGGIQFTQKTQVNGLFFRMDRRWAERVKKKYFFYTWTERPGERVSEFRLMASFSTRLETVDDLVSTFRKTKRG